MRHRKFTFKVGRSGSHRHALLANQVCSLVYHGEIRTTVVKAKQTKRLAEKMVTLGKKGGLHRRRLAISELRDTRAVKALFEAFLVGSAMGLAMRIILAAIEMAAQWMSIQMGFGMAAVFNPLFGEQLGPLSFFYSIVAMSLFFIFDIHFYFIEGIARSFEASAIDYNGMAGSILKLSGLLFPLAFKMAAPVMLVLLMVNIAVGFLSRVLPQANLYFVSVPLHIVVGIFILVVSLPLTFLVIVKSFAHVKDAMLLFVR